MNKFALMAIPILLVCSVSAHEEDWQEAVGEIRATLEESMAEVRKLKDKLQDQNFEWESMYQPSNRAALGIFLENIDGQDLTVRDFAPRSHAKEQGMEVGDVLIGVDEQDLTGANATIETLLDYLESVDPGSAVRLEIQRGDDSLTLNVKTLAVPEAMGWLGFHRETLREPPISSPREVERWPRAEIWLDGERMPRCSLHLKQASHHQGGVQSHRLERRFGRLFRCRFWRARTQSR